jgi:hypothetical protein
MKTGQQLCSFPRKVCFPPKWMKKKIKGKERKDVRRSSSFFPSKTKKKNEK